MKKSKSLYGKLLVDLIKSKNMSQVEFYQLLGIKKPYFYDIISGKSNPPPPKMQLKIIKILQLSKNEANMLLDKGSLIRNELPADIYIYLKNNKKKYLEIRKEIDFNLL